MHTKKLFSFGTVALACFVALAGCGKTDEELVAEMVANREAPAKVRLINITDSQLAMDWLDMTLEDGTNPFAFSSFRTCGTQEKEINIRTGTKALFTAKFDADPEGLHNIVAIGSGDDVSYTMFDSSFLMPQSGSNLEVRFINESGKSISGSVKLVDGSKSYDLDQDSKPLNVSVGNYELEGLDAGIGGKVEDDSYYTIVVVELRDGKRVGFLMRNALMDKVSSGAQN